MAIPTGNFLESSNILFVSFVIFLVVLLYIAGINKSVFLTLYYGIITIAFIAVDEYFFKRNYVVESTFPSSLIGSSYSMFRFDLSIIRRKELLLFENILLISSFEKPMKLNKQQSKSFLNL